MMLYHRLRRHCLSSLSTVCFTVVSFNVFVNLRDSNHVTQPEEVKLVKLSRSGDKTETGERREREEEDNYNELYIRERSKLSESSTNKVISSELLHKVSNFNKTREEKVVNPSIQVHNNRSSRTSIWFKENQADDRIIQQLLFIPLSYNSKVKLKTKIIYIPAGLADLPAGRKKFIADRCPVSTCALTADSRYASKAALRVLQADAYFEEKPQKNPKQIWMLWLLEAPPNTAQFNFLESLVNWTATYRSDSTIVTPYAKYVPYDKYLSVVNELQNSNRTFLIKDLSELKENDVIKDNNRELQNVNKSSSKTTSVTDSVTHRNHGGRVTEMSGKDPHRNYAIGKTELIAWFVSNCATRNGRWEYVLELSRYLPVHVYGDCGPKKCDRNDPKCNELLRQKYKFYLSFENSNCEYYITEKFFQNALRNDVVPIVMGARRADYEAVAPQHSFIHVEDFPSPAALAKYLLKLNSSDELYNEYFTWKSSGHFIDTKFWCRVCSMLHDDVTQHVTWYDDVNAWWRREDGCVHDRWAG